MKCGERADIEYVWGMKRHYACEKHAAQAAAIAQHMGWPFEPRRIINSNEICQSELSEAEIKERKRKGTT